MSEHEPRSDEQLRQLTHDAKHCLHVIGMATQILKGARDDAADFAQVCESIEHECRMATKLVDDLHQLAMARDA